MENSAAVQSDPLAKWFVWFFNAFHQCRGICLIGCTRINFVLEFPPQSNRCQQHISQPYSIYCFHSLSHWLCHHVWAIGCMKQHRIYPCLCIYSLHLSSNFQTFSNVALCIEANLVCDFIFVVELVKNVCWFHVIAALYLLHTELWRSFSWL